MSGHDQQRLASGKLSSALLQAAVLSRTGRRRPEVVVRAGIGLDSTAIDLGGDLVVMSTDPITGAAGDAGYWAVHVACNDVAVFGAEPVAVLMTVLLPEGVGQAQLHELAESAHHAALELGIEIAGGHTEVTPAVRAVVLSTTAVGRVARDRMLTPGGARAGDWLVLTKAAGLEGTSILAEAFAERLGEAGVPAAILAEAVAMRKQLSVVPDARAARDAGATAMHDPTEGGILGAAYELAEAAGLGMVVRERDVPRAAATTALAAALGFDPLRLISSGALMVAVPPRAGPGLLAALAEAGIAAAHIGELVAPELGRSVARADGSLEAVQDTPRDELWRLLHDGPA
jgi:hydrogenase maturation factor